MEIKFNSDGDFALKQMLELYNMIMVVRMIIPLIITLTT